MIQQAAYAVEPWCVREQRAGPGHARAERVGVRAVQRAHRPARQPRRGRAARAAGHLPQLGVRAAAAAVRRGRLRLPGVGPDDHQRHQRQADPAAGRRRAVRRAVRRAARARAGPRPARRHPDPYASSGPRRPATRSASPRSGWSRSSSGPSPRSATRSRRSTSRYASSCSPSWSPTRRCRARASDPRAHGRHRVAAGRRGERRRQGDRRHGAPHPRERAAGRRGHGPRDRRAGRHRSTPTSPATSAASPSRPACSPASGCASSSSSPTAGRASGRAGRARPGDRRAGRRAAVGLGGAAGRTARVPRRRSGPAPTSRSTATRRCSRPCGSGCSTCCRPARAASGGRSRPRG